MYPPAALPIVLMKSDTKLTMNWFKRNEMVATREEFQPISFGLKEDYESGIEINGDVIEIYDTVKLLGVTIDSKLRFNENVKSICQKTNSKVKAFQGLYSRVLQAPLKI